MIKDAHKVLLRNVSKQRGASIIPGEFRRDQNWIGARTLANARFVPPPPQEVVPAMSDLEKYVNNMEDALPLLINLSLIHYQFGTIHPFPDGNGRVGRLLMPLILCERKAMSQPLLYLSSYFERNYEAYIENMLNVSKHNRWEDWIRFFLNGVEESAHEAIHKARKLQDLQREYYLRIQQARTSALLGRVIEALFSHPALTVPIVANMLNISYNAAKSNIERLMQHEILYEAEYYYYPRAYVAKGIIGIMNE
jgi:Fic family protein